ncbi:MAG: bestrophin family ion channel [Myxococcota bacterium]
MYTRRQFEFRNALRWNVRGGLWSGLWALLITIIHTVFGIESLALPALPVTVLGTAVAFYLGFKGNAAYDRLWEARKIWGGIVNSSRTWGAHVIGMVTDRDVADAPSTPLAKVHRELILRHVGWLSALRTQLRRRKTWENDTDRNNYFRKLRGTFDMSPERLRSRLEPYVTTEELEAVMQQANQATQLIRKQGERLRDLRDERRIDDFRHIALAKLLEEFYTLQGKCERIKNFPLPRQYATANLWFVIVFLMLMPFALLGAFDDSGHWAVWLTVPTSAIVGWVFVTWNLVLDYTENPFEGLINDIPMDALSRTIEIDMLQMLGDTSVPKPIQPDENGGLY